MHRMNASAAKTKALFCVCNAKKGCPRQYTVAIDVTLQLRTALPAKVAVARALYLECELPAAMRMPQKMHSGS